MRLSYARVFVSAVFCLVFLLFGWMFPAHSANKSMDDPFTAVSDEFSVHGITALAVLANDQFNGYSPTASTVSTPAHGTLYNFVYTPDNGFSGTDSFSYHLCTSTCTNTVTVTLDVVNSPPVLQNRFFFVTSNTSRDLNLFEGTYDPDGDGYGLVFVTTPSRGALMGTVSPGIKTYLTDGANQYLDTFSYYACDGLGACSGTVNAYVFVGNYPQGGTCSFAAKGAPKEAVGRPVNVTNGNMWLSQSDYHLPAVSESLDVTRVFNTAGQRDTLFGRGWTTLFDEIFNHLVQRTVVSCFS